jgi:hypothetical protein
MISPATSFPNPSLGLLVLDRNFADVGVPEGTYPDVDRHFADVAEFGFELDVVDRMDNSPADSEDDRLCECPDRGDRGVAGLGEFNVDEMSMLPPPSTVRLSNDERTVFNV